MVVNSLMFVMLVVSGVLGSAIAWDDFVKSKNQKDDVEAEHAAK